MTALRLMTVHDLGHFSSVAAGFGPRAESAVLLADTTGRSIVRAVRGKWCTSELEKSLPSLLCLL